MNSDRNRLAPQRHVLFLRRIEVRKCEHWQRLLFLVWRQHRLECFCSADANFIILLELGRWRIFVPAALVFHNRGIDAIKVAAARYAGCDGDRVAYLNTLGLRIHCHRKIPNRTGKTRRCIRRQWLYVELHRLAPNLYVASLANLSKRIAKERIRERVIQIKEIEW